MSEQTPPKPDPSDTRNRLFALAGLGLEVFGALALPVGLGYWLDVSAGTLPVGVLIGALGGFAAGMWRLLRVLKGDQ
jgi:F0F1-type ATP synthase assembly protein I